MMLRFQRFRAWSGRKHEEIPGLANLQRGAQRQRGQRQYRTAGGETALSFYVFHRRGQPIGNFRKAWCAACVAAGFSRAKIDKHGRPALDRKGQPVLESTLIFHDLRRSAVRNLVAAGVDQAVAIRVTGHQTISVFQRYRIVSDDDVRAALERTQAALGRRVEDNAPMNGQRHTPGHKQRVVVHSRMLTR